MFVHARRDRNCPSSGDRRADIGRAAGFKAMAPTVPYVTTWIAQRADGRWCLYVLLHLPLIDPLSIPLSLQHDRNSLSFEMMHSLWCFEMVTRQSRECLVDVGLILHNSAPPTTTDNKDKCR